MSTEFSSWQYNGEPFLNPGDWWGFIYIVEDLVSEKKYIGKKQFKFKKYKTVKGKRKGYFAESDWKEYYGSSETLKEQVSAIGPDSFKRTILKLCKSKSECSYWEAYFQFHYEVLLKPDEFYNEWISVKVRRAHLVKKK